MCADQLRLLDHNNPQGVSGSDLSQLIINGIFIEGNHCLILQSLTNHRVYSPENPVCFWGTFSIYHIHDVNRCSSLHTFESIGNMTQCYSIAIDTLRKFILSTQPR